MSDQLDELIKHIEGCMAGLEWADKRIKELEATQAWQPIETAPKDGGPVLATNVQYAHSLQRCGVYYWEEFPECGEAGWMHQSDEDSDARATWLTHWMPLPAPPETG